MSTDGVAPTLAFLLTWLALGLVGCDKDAGVAGGAPEPSPVEGSADGAPTAGVEEPKKEPALASDPSAPPRERENGDGQQPEGDEPSTKSGASVASPLAPTGAPQEESSDTKRPPSRSFAPIGGGDPSARACEADSDCTVSCFRDGRCCKELCGCSQVYNKEFAQRLSQAVAQNCSPDVVCPVARCVGQKGGQPVCVEGACTLKK